MTLAILHAGGAFDVNRAAAWTTPIYLLSRNSGERVV